MRNGMVRYVIPGLEAKNDEKFSIRKAEKSARKQNKKTGS